jgi:hypothetical protein
MAIQKSTFSTGGFVLHKITSATGATTMSAWYDKDGKLLDIDRRDNRKATDSDRKQAESYGRIYKDAA